MPLSLQDQALIKKHEQKTILFQRKALKNVTPATSDNDVANICSFYAAYHAMRVAILSDPIFNLSEEAIFAQTGWKYMTPETKYNTHHIGAVSNGKVSGRGWGQNQVISSLYRNWFNDYDNLYKSSVKARYVEDYSGEILPAPRDNYDAACAIAQAVSNGSMQWVMK